MTEEKEKKERQCIVMNYIGYWDGTASYSSDINDAKIFKESELPAFIKEENRVHSDPNASEYLKKYRSKIVYFDTKEGLEFLFRKYEDLQRFVEIQEPRVNAAREAMEKFWNNSEELRKYVELYNKAYHPIIGISDNYKNKLLEEVVGKK